MGLDNFWKIGQEDGAVEGSFKVCGGMCSGHGNDSFRGKVYSSIIKSITDISLYEDEISPSQVSKMNDLIQTTPFKKAASYSEYTLMEDEWADFQKMWSAHTVAGHHLISSY